MLTVCLEFKPVCGDVKGAYSHGKDIGREVYLIQPKGGLLGYSLTNSCAPRRASMASPSQPDSCGQP